MRGREPVVLTKDDFCILKNADGGDRQKATHKLAVKIHDVVHRITSQFSDTRFIEIQKEVIKPMLFSIVQAHFDGIREGYRTWAWWKDGEQQVGSCGNTLASALTKLEAEQEKAEAAIGRL